MPQCAGCQKNFSFSGYSQHLAKSQNPECHKIYEELQSFGNMLSDNPEIPAAGPSQKFQGDIFGGADAYGPEDFDWVENNNQMEIDDNHQMDVDDDQHGSDDSENGENHNQNDEEDEEQLLAEEYEEGWEDLDANQNELNFQENDEEEASSDVDLDSTPLEHQESQSIPKTPVIERFLYGNAGAPIAQMDTNGYQAYQVQLENPESCWSPFISKMDWEIAQWAKLRGPGSTAFTDLLKIEGVKEALGLSYSNSQELNQLIDSKLPIYRPRFKHREVVVAGEAFDVHFRDIIECIKALFGDPEMAQYLILAPERHYIDEDKTIRCYHDMHTGKWWWNTQV
jgi:hypothetical protein